jgi:hypothetical protein
MKNKRKIRLPIIFFLLLLTLSLSGKFEVTKVYDGDTVKAEGHDIKFRIFKNHITN